MMGHASTSKPPRVTRGLALPAALPGTSKTIIRHDTYTRMELSWYEALHGRPPLQVCPGGAVLFGAYIVCIEISLACSMSNVANITAS